MTYFHSFKHSPLILTLSFRRRILKTNLHFMNMLIPLASPFFCPSSLYTFTPPCVCVCLFCADNIILSTVAVMKRKQDVSSLNVCVNVGLCHMRAGGGEDMNARGRRKCLLMSFLCRVIITCELLMMSVQVCVSGGCLND
jgi:hypothetical protein